MKPRTSRAYSGAGMARAAAELLGSDLRPAAQLQQAATTVELAFCRGFHEWQRIEAELIALVRVTVGDCLRANAHGGLSYSAVLAAVAQGARAAAEQADGRFLYHVKPIAQGAVLGVHACGGELGGGAFDTARVLVRHSAHSGEDLGQVARQAVLGTAQAAASVGADAERVAAQAARGAIVGAGELGQLALSTVRHALRGLTARRPAPH